MVERAMSEIRILLASDKEAVLQRGLELLALKVSDPMEREMQSWSAPWRSEALDHYLPQGWSYGEFEGDRLRGFLLAQPFLFHRGHTQTLWVECVGAETAEVAERLIDTAWRWARDKHFQCLLLESAEDWAKALASRRPHPAAPLIELRTTRT